MTEHTSAGNIRSTPSHFTGLLLPVRGASGHGAADAVRALGFSQDIKVKHFFQQTVGFDFAQRASDAVCPLGFSGEREREGGGERERERERERETRVPIEKASQ